MSRGSDDTWMWAEACAMLARAERLQRHSYEPRHRTGQYPVVWQPPVDVLETDRDVLILVALPGVDPAAVDAAIEDGTVRVAGKRVLPPELQTARIHRLELPQGRFERQIPLPPGRYTAIRHAAVNGCLLIRLDKAF